VIATTGSATPWDGYGHLSSGLSGQGPEPQKSASRGKGYRGKGYGTKVVHRQRLADTGRSGQNGCGTWFSPVCPPEAEKLKKSEELQASSSGAETAREGSSED